MADNITFMEISHITMMGDISASNKTIGDDDDDYDYFDLTQRANRILGKPTRIIALILGTCAVTANVLSLVMICKLYRTRETLSSHLAFIISLAASDMLFCLSVMFHIVNKVVNPVYYQHTVCVTRDYNPDVRTLPSSA